MALEECRETGSLEAVTYPVVPRGQSSTAGTQKDGPVCHLLFWVIPSVDFLEDGLAMGGRETHLGMGERELAGSREFYEAVAEARVDDIEEQVIGVSRLPG